MLTSKQADRELREFNFPNSIYGRTSDVCSSVLIFFCSYSTWRIYLSRNFFLLFNCYAPIAACFVSEFRVISFLRVSSFLIPKGLLKWTTNLTTQLKDRGHLTQKRNLEAPEENCSRNLFTRLLKVCRLSSFCLVKFLNHCFLHFMNYWCWSWCSEVTLRQMKRNDCSVDGFAVWVRFLLNS